MVAQSNGRNFEPMGRSHALHLVLAGCNPSGCLLESVYLKGKEAVKWLVPLRSPRGQFAHNFRQVSGRCTVRLSHGRGTWTLQSQGRQLSNEKKISEKDMEKNIKVMG